MVYYRPVWSFIKGDDIFLPTPAVGLMGELVTCKLIKAPHVKITSTSVWFFCSGASIRAEVHVLFHSLLAIG